MTIITLTYLDILLRLGAAVLFGGLVGIERVMAHKKAGVRTYALVSLGSALFIITAQLVTSMYYGLIDVDPTRIASNIVMGIGFLGGGLIILNGGKHLRGVTTAAGLWIAAGIGMAVGFGFFGLGFISAILTIFIFTGLWYFELLIKKISPPANEHDN